MSAPVRLAFFQERRYAFAEVVRLANACVLLNRGFNPAIQLFVHVLRKELLGRA